MKSPITTDYSTLANFEKKGYATGILNHLWPYSADKLTWNFLIKEINFDII